MTNNEIKKKQEETLENLKKYNKERNTEIVDDPEEVLLNELLDEVGYDAGMGSGVFDNEPKTADEAIRKYLDLDEAKVSQDFIDNLRNTGANWDDDEVEPDPGSRTVSHFCEFCGSVAYQGQIHGLGYCKEKVQYEQ
jgi:hypothetical protein